MSKIGYARCSIADQNPARQKGWLQSQRCERIYVDMLSGKDTHRPQLQAMLDYAHEGDMFCVEPISRLARQTGDFLSIVNQLTAKGVQFYSQKLTIDTTIYRESSCLLFLLQWQNLSVIGSDSASRKVQQLQSAKKSTVAVRENMLIDTFLKNFVYAHKAI